MGVIHVDSSRQEASCAFLKEEDQIRSLPFLFLFLSRSFFLFLFPLLRVVAFMGPQTHNCVFAPATTEPSFIIFAENEGCQDVADSFEKEIHPAFLDRLIGRPTTTVVGVKRLDGGREEAAEVCEVFLSVWRGIGRCLDWWDLFFMLDGRGCKWVSAAYTGGPSRFLGWRLGGLWHGMAR